MEQAMPPQAMPGMQRAQAGNLTSQIHSKILHDIQQTMGAAGTGWQSTHDPKLRAFRVMQLVSQLRLLDTNIQRCLGIALPFELKTIQHAPSRDVYDAEMNRKIEEITAKRAQHASMHMPNGPPMNANMVMPNNLPNNGMASMSMQSGAMGVQNGHANGSAAGQQDMGFPAHLQQQMQPSPLQLGQRPNTLDPSALQPNPMQSQIADQSRVQPQRQRDAISAPGGIAQASGREAFTIAMSLYSRMSDDQKNSRRAAWMSNLNEQQRAQVSARGPAGGDPLLHIVCVNQARTILAKRNAGQQSQQPQQQQHNGGGMPVGNPQNMMSGNVPQPSASQGGGLGMDYSSIMGQQATALKQQESGEQVVPASNNVNFNIGAGGMNAPQGINPQMLANSQGNNPQLSNQMQQLMLQQQKQQMMQRQNVLAQQQAMHQQQQANQLRGQPGGLNAPNALNGGPAGQANSPAMPMLNRPMLPPGQATPGTPQPSRLPGQPPQTPQTAAAMNLMQHHQQMIGQNSQATSSGGQGSAQQQISQQGMMKQLMQALPHHLQQEVMKKNATLEGLRHYVARWRQQQQMTQQSGNMVNGQPGQQGMPNMGANMNMPHKPQPPIHGMPGQSMQGNATPMFNAQPPLNQQPAPQMDQMQAQQELNQQHLRQRAMDSRPFPKDVLTRLGVSVPQEVQSWGRLKNHLVQNQSVLPPQVMDKVRNLQTQFFEARPEEVNSAMLALRQHMQQISQQGQRVPGGQPPQQHSTTSGPPGMPMPSGQAPAAQMVPPAAPMQQPQPPNQGPGPQGMNPGQLQNILPASMQEIQAFRQQYGQAAGLTDEQIREVLWRNKRSRQEALRNAQIQRAQVVAGLQGGMLNNAPRHPQSQQMPPGQHQPMGAQMQGQKRSQPAATNDDVMEIPNPNAPPPAQTDAPQAPPMQSSKSQQQAPQQGPRGNMPVPTKEQLAQMTPEKRVQFMQLLQQRNREQSDALRKAQMGIPGSQQAQVFGQQPQVQGNAVSAPQGVEGQKVNIQKLGAMLKEVERANPKGPPIDIGTEGLQQARALLKRLWHPTSRMQNTFPMAMSIPNFEKKLRQAMRARVLVMQNASDEHGTIRTYLSLSVQQLKELESLVMQYVCEIKAVKERLDAERGQQRQQNAQQGTSQAQDKVQAQAPQRPPATMAKPQHSSQPPPPTPGERVQGRKASNSSKAPPAPTEHKTFDWGAPSPHGVPKYEAIQNELTPDKLKFPPNKKRKPNQTESQISTPAGQSGTPGAAGCPNVGTKVMSPEQTKKQQHPAKQEMAERDREEQQKWKCRELVCDASIKGFETEEELRKHAAAEHAPVEDALAFLLENAAGALGVDEDGNVLPAVIAKGTADVKAQPWAIRAPGPWNAIKQESAMPPVTGPTPKPKGKTAATSAPSPEAPQKGKTLCEALEEQTGYRETVKARASPAMSDTPMVDKESWCDILQESFTDAAGVDEWASLGQNEKIDWGLPQHADSSPEMTPSDGTASSRASDISQSERLRINMEWDAFGNNDRHMPDVLRMQTLGLGGSPEQGKGGDGTIVANATGREAGKTNDDEFDWSRHEEASDWDTLFGANTGLESWDPFGERL